MKKLNDMLGSSNFLVTIFAIISLVFSYNGIELELNAEQLAESFKDAELGSIIATAFMLFLNPVIKILKKATEGDFDWSFLRSSNFIIQVGSAIVLLLGSYFNAMDIVAAVAAALAGNTANFLGHAVSPLKNKKLI